MLLKGMRLGLDVSVFIVQLVKSPLYHDACLANSVGGMVKKVSGVVNQFVRTLRGLLDMGCSPFLVFDGHLASKPKDGERKRREERRNNALRALRDHAAGTKLLTPEDLKRNERASFKPGNELMDAVHFAALEMGINCVRAPMQADQQLVYFEATGVIDAIASVDSAGAARGAATSGTTRKTQCAAIAKAGSPLCSQTNGRRSAGSASMIRTRVTECGAREKRRNKMLTVVFSFKRALPRYCLAGPKS